MSSNDVTSLNQLNNIENQPFLIEQKNKIIDKNVFITTTDIYGNICDISQSYLNFTGFSKEEVIGKNHKMFRNSTFDKSVIKDLWDTVLQDKIWSGELKNNKVTGQEFWVQTTIEPLYDTNNVKIGYLSIQEDITTKKRLEKLSTSVNSINSGNTTQDDENKIISKLNQDYIEDLKNIDQLTKLPNKSALVNDISMLKDEAMLVILHINQLNSIKELYGVEFTHEIILRKSDELQKILNEKETNLYTLNFQEFAILITDKVLFEKYFLILQHSILSNNDATSHNLSAGISYGVEGIFNHAELVLQEAIISKVSYKVYENNLSEKEIQKENLNRLQIYKNALHTGNIIPYLQPILDATDDSIVKYEALARIQTDDGEIISPYYFLDSAKLDKTFEFFTRQMMQKIFNIYSNNDVNITINLSFENINSQTTVEYIKNRLEKYGGDGITFEILESEDILDYNIIESFVEMIKQYGCKISIDDFGSGYSNFTNILRLNIDYIKLDGSLVQKLNTDPNVKNMVEGLLLYTKSAGIKTIAEYVCSKEIADTVKELSIDYMQGYYYGEPQAPEYYGLK